MGGRPAVAAQHNLPRQTTTFVGRDADLAELRELLGERELVTITGPGGTGKTRLAVEAALDCADLFPDGIWIVELASLSDRELVAHSIAEALCLRTTEDPLEQIVARVADRETLIVLDNCEHVLDGCATTVSAIVRATGDARVLATSREPLRVSGETEFRLTPLPLPDEDATADRIGAADAVRLFCERASRARRGFTMTDDEAPYVAAICRALDGIPLAIELAAARVGTLSIPDIAKRVRDRTDLLVSRDRRAADRQRTLEACIGWSYDLLSEDERTVFTNVSVFCGDFTVTDARHVCADAPVDVDDVLGSLVDRSLVEVSASAEQTGYRLLETIRAFAASKASEAGVSDDLSRRHLAWTLELVRRAEGEFDGPDVARWFELIERANDDLRQALTWGIENDHQRASEIGAGLAKFWIRRGQLAEGRRWLEALETKQPEPSTRTRILQALGDIASEGGDHREARLRYERAIELAQVAADRRALVRLLGRMAEIDRAEARYAEGREVLTEALGIARDLGDETLLVETEYLIGTIDMFQSDLDAAGARFEALRSRFASMNDPRREALIIHTCGVVEQVKGNLTAALRHYEDALAIRRRIGDRMHVLGSLVQIADVLRARGRIDEAETYAKEAHSGAVEMGAVDPTWSSLSLLAMVTEARGDLRAARGLRHEAEGVARRLGPAYHAYALGEIGALDALLGRYDDAEGALRESADAFLSMGDDGHAAEELAMLADLELRLGRDSDAAGHLEKAETLGGENAPLQAQIDVTRAEWLHRAGRSDEARTRLDDALAFADEAGLDPLKIAIEMVRARIEADTGDLETAARRLRNALELSRAIGVRHRTSDVFEDLANVSALRGAHETAVRLLGAAERFRESSGLVDPPLRQRELASIEAGAVTAIGRDRVDAAWAQGRALSDDRAANYALLDDTSELDGIDPDQRPSDADPSEQAAFGTFVLEGDYWTIEHASSVVRIKDAVGMRYLAHLLTHPVNELHVFELVALLRGTFGSADASGEDLAIDAREGIDTIDANAREAYRARLDELRSDITEAEEWGDGERAARAKAEMDALVEQLASAFGIGGRARQTSSDANRARVAVTKALRTAIRRITETTPDLGEHLGRAVRTGVFCSYEADPLRPLVVR